ncbi:hypothetical protein [Burkholderia multivorans]|uniref:hypothetical protein n=1 Tax=Burkholderia multivorans TaxID=87883 RepID=UPI0021C135B0|nr:hypothetical protein [Burkholderia multivorans]
MAAGIDVKVHKFQLGGQEPGSKDDALVGEISSVDFIVDATGDHDVFNYAAAAARLKMPSDFRGFTPIMYPPLSGKPGEIATQVLTAPIYELETKIRQGGCRELK